MSLSSFFSSDHGILQALRTSPQTTCDQNTFITNGEATALGSHSQAMKLSEEDKETLGVANKKKFQVGMGSPSGYQPVQGQSQSFEQFAFTVTKQSKFGSSCGISCEKLADRVFQLNVTKNGSDFYFPYVMGGEGGGVGMCTVPIGQPDGTIVLTGSMNGCALEVKRLENSFLFIHDSNGNSLAQSDWNKYGKVVCRVEASTYEGDNGKRKGAELASAKPAASTDFLGRKEYYNLYYEHGIVCVKANGKWGVYVSGALKKSSQKENLMGGGMTSGSMQHSHFAPRLNSQVAEFDDQ